ncbi:MAG: PEP-CTERM sorting domain-containing protein [Syntrophales bacterium]
MKVKVFIATVCTILLVSFPAYSGTVNVDLSGATTGTFIDGVGADFATAFVGQTYDGAYNLSGLPSGPLTLNPIRTLDVESWSPGVSPTSNSILPEPGNQGPLSILLENKIADSITWTMGYANPPSSITIDFFDINGNLVHQTVQSLIEGYNIYSYSGFGNFAALSLFDDNDGAGLRFQNISYDQVTGAPEPATMLLLGLGLIGVAGIRRKLKG